MGLPLVDEQKPPGRPVESPSNYIFRAKQPRRTPVRAIDPGPETWQKCPAFCERLQFGFLGKSQVWIPFLVPISRSKKMVPVRGSGLVELTQTGGQKSSCRLLEVAFDAKSGEKKKRFAGAQPSQYGPLNHWNVNVVRQGIFVYPKAQRAAKHPIRALTKRRCAACGAQDLRATWTPDRESGSHWRSPPPFCGSLYLSVLGFPNHGCFRKLDVSPGIWILS